jgi:PhnB protein
MIKLDPYLFFKGNAQEAMEFYKGIFGGKLSVQKYEDVPGDTPEQERLKGQVMHAGLEGGIVTIYASDYPEASDKTAKVELCLSGDDEEKMREMFDKLGAGGNIKYPLKKEFWGDIFGTLTDKYGVDWMINITVGGRK